MFLKHTEWQNIQFSLSLQPYVLENRRIKQLYMWWKLTHGPGPE